MLTLIVFPLSLIPLPPLAELDPTGFLFFTNYTSRKSGELTENPFCSLTFYWREVSRSIRISGRASKLSAEASKAYFESRPRGSKLGAYASKQSSVIGEQTLEERMKNVEGRFGGKEDGKEGAKEVERPEFWGGWRVVPE
jgi:pyridoxamine-phosphate oxidase